MNRRILILFFITFILKDITTSPSKYDITKTLQNSIQSMHPSIAEFWKFLSNGERKSQDMTFNSKVKNKIYICDLSLDSYQSDDFHIYYDFINNKVTFTLATFNTKNRGWIREKNNPKEKHFTDHRIYYYGNIALESDGWSVKNVSGDSSFYYDSLFEQGDVKDLTQNLLKASLVKQTTNQLVENISPRIKKFVTDLEKLTRTIFTSNHPDFLRDKDQYYYLIPNISLICFNLRHITIKGLTNFHSLKTRKTILFYTLWMKGIRGEMTLDYGSEIETPLKLNFNADFFTISFNSSKSGINVQFVNYQIFRTKQNVLVTDQQSAMIIQRIESVMASSLMPSMQVWWTNEQLSWKQKMESSSDGEIFNAMLQHSDLETKKKALEKWIPFNEGHNTTVEKLHFPGGNRAELNHYRVLFRNVTIKLISNFTYPENLLCELPNNLNIIREIRATPINTEISTNNGTENDNDINIAFHVDFPLVNFSKNKPNSSHEKNNCEYQLRNYEDIDVNLPPAENTSSNKESELKKKIDTTLISMAKERIILNIKPVLCSSYNVCSRSIKMVHDLFFHYIDKVLEKCSLQRKL